MSSQRGRKSAPPKKEEPDEEHPDYVLIKVEETELSSSKTRLAEQSRYFQKKFFSSWAEKNCTELSLKGVKSADFQLWLKIIDGKGGITDNSVESLLRLSQYLESFDSQQKCIEFLIYASEKTLKEKFVMADRFRLEDLITHVLSNVRTPNELNAIASVDDMADLHRITLTHVIQKSYLLHGFSRHTLGNRMAIEEAARQHAQKSLVASVRDSFQYQPNPAPAFQVNQVADQDECRMAGIEDPHRRFSAEGAAQLARQDHTNQIIPVLLIGEASVCQNAQRGFIAPIRDPFQYQPYSAQALQENPIAAQDPCRMAAIEDLQITFASENASQLARPAQTNQMVPVLLIGEAAVCQNAQRGFIAPIRNPYQCHPNSASATYHLSGVFPAPRSGRFFPGPPAPGSAQQIQNVQAPRNEIMGNPRPEMFYMGPPPPRPVWQNQNARAPTNDRMEDSRPGMFFMGPPPPGPAQ